MPEPSIPPANSPLAAFADLWRDAVTVYCGSSAGNSPAYIQAANQLGAALARHSKPLVYGGGTSGLMGAVASACVNAGGRVHGVIPQALKKIERGLVTKAPGVSDLIDNPTPIEAATRESRSVVTSVDTMHQRKLAMADHCDGFIALPGGYGTLEELAEAVTWTQLGRHHKLTVLINVEGFYSPLESFIDGAVAANFIPAANRRYIVFVTSDGSPTFDWGEAAIKALDDWQRQAANGPIGLQYAKWADK